MLSSEVSHQITGEEDIGPFISRQTYNDRERISIDDISHSPCLPSLRGVSTLPERGGVILIDLLATIISLSHFISIIMKLLLTIWRAAVS